MIALNLIFGIIITVLGMIFTRQLLTLSGAEGEILNTAERYLRIIFAGSLFVNFGQSANMIMRGEGILKKAMLITGTGAVLNIILDPIMIIIMKNQGKGVEGAAYAAGTNFGAKQYDRVKQVTKAFIIGATVIGLIFYVPIQLAPGTILSWFIKDKDIVSQGVTDFRILFSTYILLGFVLMVITLMQSLGKASKASVLVLMRQIILFVPLAIILPQIGGLGIDGVFLGPAVTDLLVLVLAIVMLAGEFHNISQLAKQKK